MARPLEQPPPGAASATLHHRVAFYETDAMGIVHHANYARFFELARVVWLDQHDQPYRAYAAAGLHFATTALEIRYHRSASFDDVLAVTTWPEWVRRASLRMGYVVYRGSERVATGASEHAMVDEAGRPRPIPRERRAVVLQRLAPAAAAPQAARAGPDGRP